MEYCGKYSLKNHSTLKIGPVNGKVVYIDKKEDIESAVDMAKELKLTPYPLGSGSNTIFSDSVVDKYLFLIPRASALSVIPAEAGIQSEESKTWSHEYFSTEKSLDPDSHRRAPSLKLGPTPISTHLHENDNAGEDDNSVLMQIDAGLEWDKAVEQTVEMGLSGLEALSWIPGLVGASPVQNIGAYGAEAKDSIHTVHTFDMKEKKYVDFNNKDCEFEYRNSIFKKNPGRYFIYAVTFSLSKIPPSVPQYKDVISYFESKNNKNPTLKEIREAIIEIRKAKLPDPKITPNAGSYFGNPIVSKETASNLLDKFPEIPMFDFEPSPSVITSPLSFPRRRESMDPRIRKDDKQEYKKLFAGWLIDKAGLKGYEKSNFSIHKNHALVIIGNGKGTLPELLEFENLIKQKVFEMFGVELEREPVVVK
jgi:UDP-N-acetylmuramate dehydrogenase